MTRVVKCEQCGSRFRPEMLLAESSVDEPQSEQVVRCPRCDTLHVPPDVPPKNWRLYGLAGLAVGILIAGGMLLASWLGTADPPGISTTDGELSRSSDGTATHEGGGAEDAPEPVLPGAVAVAPDWLDTAGPFNPHDLFDAPNEGQNAAPLYLDALIDFSSELVVCLPEGFREARLSKARRRSQEFVPLFRQWQTDPQGVDITALKLCLAGYNESFAKLDEAQELPRCVFISDWNLFAEQRHVNAAHEAANVALLKMQHTLREPQRATRKTGGDEPDSSEKPAKSAVEQSLAIMQQVLRLSRDLRPRGRIETQLASLAIDQTMFDMVPELVARSELTVADCDQITGLLTRHRAETMDPCVEGLRSEYLLMRTLLHDLQSGRGLLPESQIQSAGDASEERPKVPVAESVSPGYLLASKSGVENVARRAMEIDSKLAVFMEPDFEVERDTMDAIWTELFQASGSNAAARRAAALSAEEKLRTETVLLGSLSRITELSDVSKWWEANLNALHCVVAIRRWELEHTEPPTDLLTAVRQSGLPFIPIDPFGGGPLRLSFRNQEAIIYSLGPDGVDDAAKRVVETFDPDAKGDLVFRIPYQTATPERTLKRVPGARAAGF